MHYRPTLIHDNANGTDVLSIFRTREFRCTAQLGRSNGNWVIRTEHILRREKRWLHIRDLGKYLCRRGGYEIDVST